MSTTSLMIASWSQFEPFLIRGNLMRLRWHLSLSSWRVWSILSIDSIRAVIAWSWVNSLAVLLLLLIWSSPVKIARLTYVVSIKFGIQLILPRDSRSTVWRTVIAGWLGPQTLLLRLRTLQGCLASFLARPRLLADLEATKDFALSRLFIAMWREATSECN